MMNAKNITTRSTILATTIASLIGSCNLAMAQQASIAPQPMPGMQMQGAPSVPAQPMPVPTVSGRVISSTPVVQQVAVPNQTCGVQPVAVQPPNTGGGALLGAIAGGAIGNALGGGPGKALATAAGVVGGAIVGNNIEGSAPAQIQNIQTCSTQTVYETRTVGYNVVYEYAGQQFSAQLPQDPGQSVQLQISPVGATPAAMAAPQVVYAPPVVAGAAAPYPYAYGYAAYPYLYPSVSIGVGFGYYGGYGRRHGHH